jgi:hypothetical protein
MNTNLAGTNLEIFIKVSDFPKFLNVIFMSWSYDLT